MIRRLVAGLIVVGLAVGIWALWPRGDSDTTPTTLPFAGETTVGPTTTVPITTTVPTTTSAAGRVVASVEEAEEILRELWFGWFEGIYNQDEERIREVVGTQAMLDAARAQFDQMEFERAPDPADLQYSDSELLRADEACLVVWTETSMSGTIEAVTVDVHVMRVVEEHWVLVSLWQHRNDLWETDCDAQLLPFS